MNVFVTGSEGAIGQFVVEQLYREHQNINVVRMGRTAHNNLDGKSRYYWGDLSDTALLREIVRDNEISHIIAIAARWNGMNEDPQILSNNIAVISNLLTVLDGKLDKLVFISSSAVYQDVEPLEDSVIPLDQRSSYGTSKLFGEQLVQRFAQFFDFRYTIFRPFHIVSPAENFEWGRSHVTTDMCHRMIEQGEHIDLNKLGNVNGTGFMWVEDMAKIVSNSLVNDKTDNEIINLGTPEGHSIRELANEVIKVAHANNLIERQPQEVVSEVASDSQGRRFDKMQKLCVDFPLTSFSDCVSRFIQYKYL